MKIKSTAHATLNEMGRVQVQISTNGTKTTFVSKGKPFQGHKNKSGQKMTSTISTQ